MHILFNFMSQQCFVANMIHQLQSLKQVQIVDFVWNVLLIIEGYSQKVWNNENCNEFPKMRSYMNTASLPKIEIPSWSFPSMKSKPELSKETESIRFRAWRSFCKTKNRLMQHLAFGQKSTYSCFNTIFTPNCTLSL